MQIQRKPQADPDPITKCDPFMVGTKKTNGVPAYLFLGEKILWRYETRYSRGTLAILAKNVLAKELVILYSPLVRKEGKPLLCMLQWMRQYRSRMQQGGKDEYIWLHPVSSADQCEDRQRIALREIQIPEENIYLDRHVQINSRSID